LREIVDRATGAVEEKHERRTRRYRPSRILRTLIGIALFLGGLSGFGYGLVHMMHIGNCASGPTPYAIERQCPSGSGWYFLLLVGSIFAALIGAAVAGLGLALPMGVGFTVIGAVAVYGGLTAPDSAQGAALAGYTVGPIFIVMGLVYLGFAIWSRRSSGTDTEPTISAVGLSQLIAATAPKPLPSSDISKEEDKTERGG
jgi:hypothetical protein